MGPSEVVVSYSRIPQHLPQFDAGVRTRSLSIVGLVAALLAGIAALGTGAWLRQRQTVKYHDIPNSYNVYYTQTPLGLESTTLKEVIALILNAYITACTEALGFIHSASLRWALYNEGRLRYNSNLRLFTSAKSCWVNGWLSNFLWAISLSLAYASVGQIVMPHDPYSLFPEYIYSASALIILGVALLCQALLGICCLAPSKQKPILSWSSSPLNTALTYQHRNGRPALHSLKTSTPKPHQQSAWRSIKIVRRVIIYLWILVPVTVLWGILIWFLAIKDLGERDLSFSPNDDTGGFYPSSSTENSHSQHAINILIISALQLFYTMALHAAEQIVNITRDEKQWRRTSRLDQGAWISPGSLTAALTSWETLTLLVLKPVGHWLFGLSCVSFWYGWLAFHPIPIFCVSGIAFLLSTFVTTLALWKYKGPQPSTYGDLQYLSELVDDWGQHGSKKLYWGDKGVMTHPLLGVVRIAGCSGEPQVLQPIRLTQEPYLGLSVTPAE